MEKLFDKASIPILAEDLSFQRGQKTILKKVNLRLLQGEFLGLVGPNGAGKTTLVRLLLGLLSPQCGRVLVFGEKPRQLYGKSRLVGYLPQKSLSDPHFPVSVYDVVKMARAGQRGLLKFWQQEDDLAVRQILERLDILKLAQIPVGELSGGQQQRVFLARALVNEPALLLADEPTTGLDPQARANFYHLVQELKQERNLAVLAVSHDIEKISNFADRMVYLDITASEKPAHLPMAARLTEV